MTDNLTGSARSDADRDSDTLETQLHTLIHTPLLKRGDAALRLAALTIAALRRIERRLAALEQRMADDDTEFEEETDATSHPEK